MSFTQLPDDILRLVLTYSDFNFAFATISRLNSYHYRKSAKGDYLSLLSSARITLANTDLDTRSISQIANSLSKIKTLESLTVKSDQRMNV